MQNNFFYYSNQSVSHGLVMIW